MVSLQTRAGAEGLEISVTPLPALRIGGETAKAHTQGLEIVSEVYYVTARREDVQPRRALLLRTDPSRTEWDVWDITPVDERGNVRALDHPGGMQSDGEHLWIPLAESRRNGRSVIRRYAIAELVPGQAIKAAFEFPVNDHIGALAVSEQGKMLLGASWDTEKVYVWDFEGRLRRTMSAEELSVWEIGAVNGPNGRAGLAVQDWKWVGERLYAAGLFRGPGVSSGLAQSRLVSYAGFLETGSQWQSTGLPRQGETELAHEAMAISGGVVYFVPEDLGATNRMFRVPLAELMKRAGTGETKKQNAK